MGQILTFYSYKGGAGRTMALANIAVLLSQKKKKVLIVDWDLEAPGLEYYFRDYLNIEKVAKVPGVINLLSSHNITEDSSQFISWRDCVLKFRIRNNEISLITSGQKDNINKEQGYFSLVRSLDVEHFYDEKQGGDFIEQLRNEWKLDYDYVLIDSRTGITDIGGICTIQLPDILILIFNANEQSLAGIANVAKKVSNERKKLPFDRFSLITFPIAARFDGQAEFKISQEWLDKFGAEFSDSFSNWLPQDISSRDFIEITKIPYAPYFSFGEKLPVIEHGVLDPTGLGFAYETIALIIANNFESVDNVLRSRGLLKSSPSQKAADPIGTSLFSGKKTKPRRRYIDTRGLLSVATLLVSMGGLTVAMGGAAKLVLDIFNDGLADSFNGIWLKLIALGMAYFFGWGVALVSIRGFGNLVYSTIIKIYMSICLSAVCSVYLKIIQKLYLQNYDAQHFWAYVFMLLGGLAVLISLHLLIENHDLRPYAIPLLVISVLQLFVIVFRYVFTTDSEPMRLWGDLTIFAMMISVSALMVMHLGVLSPLRNWIDGIFRIEAVRN